MRGVGLRRAGWVHRSSLSPARATLLTVGVILLLAVAFGAGLLVGRFYL